MEINLKKNSVLLSIVANDKKLPPFLIFNRNIFAICQNKAWWEMKTFKKCFKIIFLNNEKNIIKKNLVY